MTEKFRPLDCLNRELNIGDAVCYADHNRLHLGTVKKIHTKMVTVWDVGPQMSWYTGSKKYPHDMVRVEGPDVTMYLLKMK